MFNYKEFLQERYNRIWDSSKESILSNNIEIDPNLLDIKNDKRLGLTLLTSIEGEVLTRFLEITNQLKEIEPNQYYHPSTNIHITIFDFISCSEDFIFDERQAEIYEKIIYKVIKNFSKFNIEFKGLTASKRAIMVQGFSDDVLQELRERLREEANKRGIELKERYKIETAHSTIMRFKTELQNPEALVNRIEEMRNVDLGIFEVRKILFLLHDWYNIKEKSKMLKKYELH